MNHCLLALALLLIPSWPIAAGPIDLDGRIAPGKWSLDYQRTGSFKPLGLKHKEQGTSHVCMEGDPRRQIMAWLAGKGCVVDQETMEGEVYRLHGACALSWWKDHPIPVSLELRPETRDAFSMTISTDAGSVLGFVERTRASRQGDCDADAKAKRGKGGL